MADADELCRHRAGPNPDRVIYACIECGSLHLQSTAWIVMNTGEDSGSEGPLDTVYCPDCAEETGDGHHKRFCVFKLDDPERECMGHAASNPHKVEVNEDQLKELLNG